MTDWLWVNVGRGRLHPESAEWMMLWPVGWTDLKPLGTDKSPSVPQPLGECLQEA
jgi:hypothetical protein